MTETTNQGYESGRFVETWMEMTKVFWKDIGTKGMDNLGSSDLLFNFPNNGKQTDDSCKAYKTWETSVNNAISLLKQMGAAKNQESLYKSFSTFFDAVTQASGDSLENFTEFQSQLLKSIAKVGEHTKTFRFDDLDHSTFESFRELYRTELQKYLKIPKIGLPREFHEKLSDLADKSNIFSSHLLELLYQFSTPFEKTNRAMQEKIKKMLEDGEIPTDSKEVYSEWIKALERHFMDLLKSSEYTNVLNNTITSLAAYKGVKNNMTDIFLKEMQIPTGREMDEVYKDIYQMKKKIKELSHQVEILQDKLKG